LEIYKKLQDAEHPDIATSINDLAGLYRVQGRYTEAEPLYKQALEMRQKLLGSEHPDIATSLNNLAALYQAQGRYTEAEAFSKKALEMYKKLLGADHPNVAASLNNLVALYQAQGRYTEAEAFSKKALEMYKKLLGPKHPDIATSLNNLAALYQAQGRYQEAEIFYKKALEMYKELPDAEHPDVANPLNNLAALYQAQGRYREAEPLYKQALEMRQKLLGSEHPDVAISLNNLAALYSLRGRYQEAEIFYKKALEMYKKLLDAEHPDIATSINDLAGLYRVQGRYREAEPLLKQALEMRQKLLGSEHPDIATSLNNLATLYQAQGRYKEAEPFSKKALEMYKKLLGAEHPDIATILNNLALLYDAQGRYTEAEPLLKQALEMYKKFPDAEHPNVANPLNNLAALYQAQGRYTEAEQLLKQALEIQQKLLGSDHPNVAATLTNWAGFYQAQGSYTEAEALLKQALEIGQKLLGAEHPDIATILNNFAKLYQAQGNIASALQFFERGLEVQEKNLTYNLAAGSEPQKQKYLKTLLESKDDAISLHLQHAPTNPDAANLSLTTILRRKGRILDSTIDSLQTIRDNPTPENQKLLNKLTNTRTQLANLWFRKNRPPLEQYLQQLATLKRKVEKLEADLSLASTAFRKISQPVTIEAVQKLIPTDAALVEIIQYKPPVEIIQYKPADSKAKPEDKWVKRQPPRYAAYILHSTGAPQWLDLGAAEPIHKAIIEFRNTLSNEPNRKELEKAIIQTKTAARTLDKLVMAPIRQKLGNAKHILLSPDSQLNLVPFPALVDENNQYIVENYTITYLTSGRDLIRFDLNFPTKQPPILIGAPKYDQPGKPTSESLATNNNRSRNQRSPDIKNLKFLPLFGTKVEAEAIATMLNITPLIGSEATENALKQVKSPEIVHIATHGFFLEDVEISSPSGSSRGLILESDFGIQPQPFVPVENPLLRSGIALAGANIRQSGTEDGIMTAEEIANLNLAGTKLVILSACETGVGKVNIGEGVYGLRRALSLAGSESQVTSLWKVDDSSTKDLMIDYYQRVLNNQDGRSEALRQTQLKMLEDSVEKHPHYWASFIPSGNWRGIGNIAIGNN
jgi:tetratricopeptide (TPR) repeat protein